jgi:cyclase
MPAIPDFASKHFTIQKIAEGIYAAIAIDGGHAVCNAGLVDLGGRFLVFDTFVSPQAAQDLHRFITDHYGRIPIVVINSHYHNDHIWGNQVFAPKAPVISSTRTYELIGTSGMEEFKWYSTNSAQQLEDLRRQYQDAQDEYQRKQLVLIMGEYEGVLQALPHLKVCLPNITFDGRLEIRGRLRTAELSSYREAHSGSDTVLYLPKDKVVFMSDLLFVGFHPYLADGDPFMLLKALRELSLLNATCYVPGHGPVGSIEDVKLLIKYIEACIGIARGLIQAGQVSQDIIQRVQVPEIFAGFQLPQFYRSNITFLCKRLSSPQGNQ